MTTLKNDGLPTNNADFGDAHGVVKLTSASESTLSTDPYLNKKVKVFFKKDDMNPNTFAPFQEPNWFYYWNQFVDKKLISNLVFLTDIALAVVCKGEKAEACTKASLQYPTCYYRQIVSEETGYVPQNKGLHAFIETLAHENHHVVLWRYFWPNGYNKLEDFDGDLYPDWFEKLPENINDWGFNWKDDTDAYDYNPPHYLPGFHSHGYNYEEYHCVETQKKANVKLYDDLDWLYDPNYKYQGKQWK